MYRRSRRNKDIRKTITYCFLLFSFLGILFTEGRVLKVKFANSKLAKNINNIQKSNDNTVSENKKLLSNVKKEKNNYKNKLKNRKVAYLTFDDGPSNHTEKILNILDENNVHATFFVNGKPELTKEYKAIVKQGSILANHTYSHDYKTVYSSPENFKKDIEKLDKFLENLTGEKPSHVIRYPGGSNNTISHSYGGPDIMKRVLPYMKKAGYKHFDWTVDSRDAEKFRQDKDVIINSVLTQSKSTKNAVILMHDLNPKTTTVEALPTVIKGLKEQGFKFDVLSKDSPDASFVKMN